MLEINNLSFTFPGKKFSLTVPKLNLLKGEVIGLVGGNGSGKTTLFKLLAGIYSPESGEFNYQGKTYKSLLQTPLNIVMHNAYGALNPMLTVLQEARLVSTLYGVCDIDETILNFANMLECEDLLSKRQHELSAGQNQRAMLLRTLASSPDVVLLDEPTTGLDVCAIESILQWIDLLKQNGKTVIISSHHPYELAILKPRIIGMKQGQIKIDTSFEEKLNSPEQIRNMITSLISNTEVQNELAAY